MRPLTDSVAAVAAVFLTLAIGAGAQVTTPLHIGSLTPTVDEFGNTLQGNAMQGTLQRDLVQILTAPDSVIYPPAYDGTPDPLNPLLPGGETTIGNWTSPDETAPGIFSTAVAKPRPVNGTKVFVRVFNAPTLPEASFYGDSQVMTVSGNEVLIANIAAANQFIDPRDTDGDGLTNAWEKSLNGNIEDPDTDDDGMDDHSEARAGTLLNDADSVFVVAWLKESNPTHATVAWDSVAGRSYQVEYSTNNLAPDPSWVTNASDVITAAGAITETTITDAMVPENAFFRVRLVEP